MTARATRLYSTPPPPSRQGSLGDSHSLSPRLFDLFPSPSPFPSPSFPSLSQSQRQPDPHHPPVAAPRPRPRPACSVQRRGGPPRRPGAASAPAPPARPSPPIGPPPDRRNPAAPVPASIDWRRRSGGRVLGEPKVTNHQASRVLCWGAGRGVE